MGRLRGRVPESRPRDSWNYFYGVFLLVFVWPIIVICLVHGPYFIYLRMLPRLPMHLLVKMDSTAKAYG